MQAPLQDSQALEDGAAESAPALAKPGARPVESPARQMTKKVARAFTNGSAATAAAANDWKDF